MNDEENVRPKLEWTQGRNGPHASTKVGKFVVRFTWRVDEGGDTSWLGVFHSKHGPGTIDWQEYLGIEHHDTRCHQRYSSCNYDVTKETDREYIEKDITRLRDYGPGWYLGAIEATVLKDGVALSSASIGGVESDFPDYWDEVAWDLIPDALTEAEEKLKELIDDA